MYPIIIIQHFRKSNYVLYHIIKTYITKPESYNTKSMKLNELSESNNTNKEAIKCIV